MTTHDRFLMTPRPVPDESLTGLLVRAAEHNNYPDYRWLTRAVGISHWAPDKACDYRRLAEMMVLPQEELERRAYTPVSRRRRRYFDTTIDRGMLTTGNLKVCPQCLAERQVLRAAWELSAVTACPTHGRLLLAACPACAHPLSSKRQKVCHCPCGFDLSKAETERAKEAVIALSAAIETAAGFTPAPTDKPLAPAFYDQDLPSMLEAVRFLGTHAMGKSRGMGQRALDGLAVGDWADVAAGAAGMLAAWPDSFYALLDNLRSNTGTEATKSKSGLAAEFGSLYRQLYLRQDVVMTNAPFGRHDFETYLKDYLDEGFVSRRSPRLTPGARLSPTWISHAEAARTLNVHPAVLRRMSKAGHLETIARPIGPRRSLFLVAQADVDQLRLLKGDLLDIAGVQEIIGLAKAPTLSLANGGLLTAHSGPKVDGAPLWLFQRPAVEAFVSAITAGVQDQMALDPACGPGTGLIGMMPALRRLSFRGLEAADLLRRVVDGSLIVRARDITQVGLAQCLFAEPDLLGLTAAPQVASPAGRFSIKMAARELGLNDRLAQWLVHHNLLRTLAVVHLGRKRLVVPAEAITEFKATYISAAEVVRERGTTVTEAVAWLASHDVVPVVGPLIDGGSQHFFHRGAVRRVDPAVAGKAEEREPAAVLAA